MAFWLKEILGNVTENSYEARMYDPLGRFTTNDPLAEKFSSQSPYVYGANNPVNYIDINGDSLNLKGSENALRAAPKSLCFCFE